MKLIKCNYKLFIKQVIKERRSDLIDRKVTKKTGCCTFLSRSQGRIKTGLTRCTWDLRDVREIMKVTNFEQAMRYLWNGGKITFQCFSFVWCEMRKLLGKPSNITFSCQRRIFLLLASSQDLILQRLNDLVIPLNIFPLNLI